jgi:hypothetical protein
METRGFTFIMLTTNLAASLNLLMSTSKWFSWFAFVFSRTKLHLSRTAPMLLKYPAGSRDGSGCLGMGILGIVGVIGVVGEKVPLLVMDILGDLRELVAECVLM